MRTSLDLQELIRARGLAARLISKPVTRSTADACAKMRSLGFSVELTDFIKAIVVRLRDRERRASYFAVVMVRGTDRLSPQATAEVLGATDLAVPGAAEASAVTRYERGGTPPVGLGVETVVLDRRLVEPPRVLFGGGGDPAHLFEVHSSELVRALEADAGVRLTIADVSNREEE